MICLICRQAETVTGLVSVHFERGQMRLEINDVPARVCPRCGEAYMEEAVAVQLLKGAERISAVGRMNEVVTYDGPA